MQQRKANLDLLRATAITIVFAFHISQYVTGISETGHKIAALGSYGVDLFFVLSGWLIGGIYFREMNASGRVDLSNFWGRRWLRTMPPYFIALALSWLAVFKARHQAFDAKYLIFLQNYENTLPFFKISWSLCIEEHFYLLLPFVLFLAVKARAVVPVCLALVAASVGMRWHHDLHGHPAFGYLLTATHLRLDGLALGVLATYVHHAMPDLWPRFSTWLVRLGWAAGVVALLCYFLSARLMYSVGILALSVFFVGTLCACVNAADWRVSRSRIVYLTAVSSYSVYLIHALAINAAFHFLPSGTASFVALGTVATAVGGLLFHYSVEEVSKRIRDALFPSNRHPVSLNLPS